jgi:DNA-binding MarR family transcriptional regulator
MMQCGMRWIGTHFIVSCETIGKPQRSMGDRTELDLDHFLPYRLSVLSNRMSQAIARIYAERFDLSITEWRVMAVLGLRPNLSAGEVAERTAMDKVAVSRAVARLIEAGRVVRAVAEGDRRRSRLRLSAAGRRIHRQVAPLALAFEREALSALTAAEQVRFGRLLDKLCASLPASPGDAGDRD